MSGAANEGQSSGQSGSTGSAGSAANGAPTGGGATGAGSSAQGSSGSQGTTLGGKPSGSSQSSWRDSLPEDLRAHPSLTDIKDPAALVKSYIHAQSLVGAEKVVLPKADAQESEWGEFYKKLGRPETPEKYQFSEIKTEHVKFSEDGQKWMAQMFHKHGLTQKQADGIHQEYVTRLETAAKAEQARRDTQRAEALESLKSEWKGPTYDMNVEFAQRAIRTFGNDQLIKYLNESGEGDNPQLIKLFANIGKQLGEDRAFGKRAASSGFVSGPEAARAEIAKLQMDQQFMKAYMGADESGHKEAVAQMHQLFKVAYPGTVT